MKLFKSKKEPQKPQTNYIVYFNEPYTPHNGSYIIWQSSKKAEEYSTLEEAQKAAKEFAKYYKTYITVAQPIYEYESKIVEFQV